MYFCKWKRKKKKKCLFLLFPYYFFPEYNISFQNDNIVDWSKSNEAAGDNSK